MKRLIRDSLGIVILLIIVVPWLMGVALSKGYLAGICAILIPPYAWYLVVEKVMLVNGWLQ